MSKKAIIPVTSAEKQDYIEADKAAVSEPHTGGKDSDAGSKSKAEEFERLISEKYKNEFTERVRKIIDRRIKEVKIMKDDAEKNSRIVEMLMRKYNIQDNDTDKLERVMNTENNADNRPDDMRSVVNRLIAENMYLRKNQEKNARDMQARSRAEDWRRQAEDVKKTYPEFDMEKSLDNEEFRRLIKMGVSVKNAYEVTNIDNILARNSQTAEKNVVNSIRSKGTRPLENGSDPTGGILLSNNVSKLTKKERAKLARRAAMGERISF